MGGQTFISDNDILNNISVSNRNSKQNNRREFTINHDHDYPQESNKLSFNHNKYNEETMSQLPSLLL